MESAGSYKASLKIKGNGYGESPYASGRQARNNNHN